MMHDIVSLLRALAALTVVAGIGVGGWAGYNVYTSRNELEQERVRLTDELAGKEETIVDLRATLETKEQELQALDLAVRLLKIDHRLAEIVVLDQWETDDDGLMTKFQFVEVDKEGKPLEAAKEYTVQGDTGYIDSWVIKCVIIEYTRTIKVSHCNSIKLRVYFELLTKVPPTIYDAICCCCIPYFNNNRV